MSRYTLELRTTGGQQSRQELTFQDDEAAIWHALASARGKLLELWRGDRLIATVDERPCGAKSD